MRKRINLPLLRIVKHLDFTFTTLPRKTTSLSIANRQIAELLKYNSLIDNVLAEWKVVFPKIIIIKNEYNAINQWGSKNLDVFWKDEIIAKAQLEKEKKYSREKN